MAVLAFLLLAAALVMGTFSAGRALARAAMTNRAAARADAGARRALGRALLGWDASLDSLAVGTSVLRELPAEDVGAPPLLIEARVRRLGGGIYLVLVDARVLAAGTLLARRRYRMVVERFIAADSVARAVTPSLIGGWALDETN